MMNASNIRLKGFTLLEMAVVLGVLGVLVAGGIASLSEKRTVTKQLASLEAQESIKKQLMAFALINKYLPCPDSNVPPDGRENRSGEHCTADFGAVPYLNIGLNRDQIQDSYGNFIRYAVNQNTDDIGMGVICDNTSSASYFCDTGGDQPVFTLTNTPPLQGNAGAGNYRVCNNNAAVCSALTPNDELQTGSASVVLIAYNEDGAQTLANCGGANGVNGENCDEDAFYHQRMISTEDNDFFDDTIVFITGHEIKTQILSPITVWTRMIMDVLAPTFTAYNLGENDYIAMDDADTPDVIQVNRNVTTALNLGRGNDQITVGGDLSSELEYDNQTGEIINKGTNAALYTGEGDDTVYIVGAANSNVRLGEGNDTFVLGTNLTETLSADAGDDRVWIQGSVISGATFILGAGDDVVWLGESSDPQSGGLASNVDGGVGYDILVLENMTQTEWNADAIFQAYVANFELVVFSDNGSGIRESTTLP